jgi:RNA polymerase sigma factor (sigma-70 family)
MPPARLDSVLGATLAFLRHDARPDPELLARFLDHQDEAAFEALVLRHTPAVRAACRGWLRSPADIDDAAQATFLVLVRRARSIRDRAALGRWLYAVAVNVARRLRRQRTVSCPVPENLPGRPPAAYDDLGDLLAEEVARLPEKYRLPVQLCYAAGLTAAEAAQRLGWPRGTVLTRLAWARGRLQKSLRRRGVAPVALAALAGAATSAVRGEWVRATARAAKGLLGGGSPAQLGVSGQTVSLTEGVVRAMLWSRFKYAALAALVVLVLAGLGLRELVTAADPPGNGRRATADEESPTVVLPRSDPLVKGKEAPAAGKQAPKADEPRPAVPGRRREAIIRVPTGTFVREVNAAPYGAGRLTWTYEEDRVQGLVEGSVMGVEFELATEAEFSLSSNGTIYGLITGVQLNHLRLPAGDELGQLKQFEGLVSAAEPLINEVMLDMPFSYQFRVQGDRLIINNFRMMLAGPNPLGKLGGLAMQDGGLAALTYFQALGAAVEGTYTASDAKERPAPARRPLFLKSRAHGRAKSMPAR